VWKSKLWISALWNIVPLGEEPSEGFVIVSLLAVTPHKVSFAIIFSNPINQFSFPFPPLVLLDQAYLGKKKSQHRF